jgi:signal transduction histidine kinase
VLFSVEGTLLSWLIDKLRLASEEVIVSREELRELSDQQRSVRDAEQKRIAREIHDELGQELTGLKLGIHLLKRNVVARVDGESRSAMETEIDGLSKQVDSTIGAVRRIATDLRPSVLDDFGLVAAIDWQTNEFGERSGIECIFSSNVSNLDIDPDSSTAIFRIFQEALTNVARHADATRVRVKIELRGSTVSLTVADNGKGIDKEVLKRTKSLGMLGMRERARLIGGSVAVSRSDDGGTRVELIAPLKDPALAVEPGGQG